jgi:hypothetical protein
MSVLSVAEVEAVLVTGLDSAVIQVAIDREEAALTFRSGPLTGERTDTFHPPSGWDRPLTLRRFAPSATVEVDGEALDAEDFRLVSDGAGRAGGCLERVGARWTDDPVAVTYTPDAGSSSC